MSGRCTISIGVGGLKREEDEVPRHATPRHWQDMQSWETNWTIIAAAGRCTVLPFDCLSSWPRWRSSSIFDMPQDSLKLLFSRDITSNVHSLRVPGWRGDLHGTTHRSLIAGPTNENMSSVTSHRQWWPRSSRFEVEGFTPWEIRRPVMVSSSFMWPYHSAVSCPRRTNGSPSRSLPQPARHVPSPSHMRRCRPYHTWTRRLLP